MKIVKLLVENFRAIERVELSDLEDMIVIAGPNGSGKSCILDSIRLFKSVYGGYQPNEWQQWFGEFNIDFQRSPDQMVSLLRTPSKPAIIQATIELATDEANFIHTNLRTMLEDHVWKTIVPGMDERGTRARPGLAAELRAHKPTVDKRVEQLVPTVLQQLTARELQGRFLIHPQGTAQARPNVLLEIVFSAYFPKRIGLIDYHGSHRNYGREQLGGINLNLDREEQRYRNASLYNYGNKYTNIKSEMAAEYVRQALTEKASGRSTGSETAPPLSETLQELFKIFFPGKRFLGPVPTEDGSLQFPVELEDGSTHDINELSSGEKEVLFGYLRLRNSAPKFSVILLDEPELHLNPALVRGLPQFYLQRLAFELNNQIWLVTHSDAFLREAIGHSGLRVFHMQHAAVSADSGNQLYEIHTDKEAEAIILEMVGDLAAYRPGAKVVIFEGDNSEFDLNMVSRLFPRFEKDVNLVSGGSRSRVKALHNTLESSVNAGGIPIKIYSVVDADSEVGSDPVPDYSHHHSWDVYHIENYLLSPRFIKSALDSLNVHHGSLASEEKVDERLEEIAREQTAKLVTHQIRTEIADQLIGTIDLGSDPQSTDVALELHDAVSRSVARAGELAKNGLSRNEIQSRVTDKEALLSDSLRTDEWRKMFRGRDILRRFCGKHVQGMRYEYFRDLIVSQMVSAGYEPEGMKAVLDEILSD